MEIFKYLSKKNTYEAETDIRKSWKGVQNLYEEVLENRKDSKNFVFYDGPAFANGFPGLHHMVSKNLKDAITKYHVMQGKRIVKKIGWDTHGLPIENHVEKKLGISSKKEIEKLGVEKFNAECRKSVRENEEAFNNLTEEMGQLINIKDPYLTYKNEYIETEWWILKKMFEEGYFYEGTRVVPYCPHCGTGLATHEVAQDYQLDDTDTVYVPFKKKDEDVYFLAWTTTPWTLLANVALCVNPKEKYVKVLSKGNKFIIGKALAKSVLGEDIEILEEYTGKDLEYMEYEQLIPEIEVEGKAFMVLNDEYVTMEDGTGIVHQAPAFGADDAEVCGKYGINGINPVGKDGCYIEGPWKGMFVFDANLEIIKYLKENDKLFRKQRIKHEYPHCWRCHTPLIYYSMPSYYIRVSAMRDKLVKANNEVNWYPDYVGEKRFANWLENAKDWNVSRSRYWGSPIPYFTCECGHAEMLGSIAELKEKANEKISDGFDLHKPYIDEVTLTCPECGKKMHRIPDVLDCWFDSGSMPFAQYHYPFENKELWEEQFPADFICEGIDQTRGWFYTLLVISVFLTGKSPYKNVLVNDLLLDAEGKKMSKSRGNIVEPFTTIKEYGADAVRFYLPYVSPVWTPLKFNIEGLKEVHSKFFNPLKNTYTFFAMYANTDKIDPRGYKIPYSKREDIDKWLLSKYNKLVLNVTNAYEEYDLNKVTKYLAEFVSEDLSNWYIRRNRNRFWSSKLDNSKKSVYLTTYEVLVGLTGMLAPISPFISEEIYRNLTGEKSVHLSDFPKANKRYINLELEEKMDLVRDLISLGRNVREEAKIKVRQPISEVIFDSSYKEKISEMDNLIKEELNVKNVTYVENINKYMNIEYRPNYKEVGKVFGSNIKMFASYLQDITDNDIEKLKNNELDITINGTDYNVTKDMVDIRISSKDGYNVAVDNNKFIVLNTELTEELICEGLARETISKIQQLRKTNNFDIADRINIYYEADKEYKDKITNFIDFIKEETLGIKFEQKDNIKDKIDINEYQVGFILEKVKK